MALSNEGCGKSINDAYFQAIRCILGKYGRVVNRPDAFNRVDDQGPFGCHGAVCEGS